MRSLTVVGAHRRCALQAGGFVANNRVNGRLAVTRALGDMDFKDLKCKPHDQASSSRE